MSEFVRQPGEILEFSTARLEAELSEVRYLRPYRDEHGRYPEAVLKDALDNLVSDGYEAAVPHGVMTIDQVYRDGDYYWMGKSSVETSASGHEYHVYPFAHRRVNVETDEAVDARDNLRPGWAKVTASPRASRADASFAEAKAEQLHDRDFIRVQYLCTNSAGKAVKRIESIQVYDMPLEAYEAWLNDPNNVFNQIIAVSEPGSALAVMQTHARTYVPLDRLPQVSLSILKEITGYVTNYGAKTSLTAQIKKFETDQATLRRNVEAIASERLTFIVELVDSLEARQASPYIRAWLEAHADQLGGQNGLLVKAMRNSSGFKMNEALALLASKINKAILWTRAGIVVNNQDLIKDLPAEVIDHVNRQHNFSVNNSIPELQRLRLQVDSNRHLATFGIAIGGGCSPMIEEGLFNRQDQAEALKLGLTSLFGNNEKNYKFDRKMYCVVCQNPPKSEAEPKKMCGPCDICKDCDDKLRSTTAKAA